MHLFPQKSGEKIRRQNLHKNRVGKNKKSTKSVLPKTDLNTLRTKKKKTVRFLPVYAQEPVQLWDPRGAETISAAIPTSGSVSPRFFWAEPQVTDPNLRFPAVFYENFPIFLSLFFEKKQGKPTKKQKNKEFLERPKGKEIQKSKERKIRVRFPRKSAVFCGFLRSPNVSELQTLPNLHSPV